MPVRVRTHFRRAALYQSRLRGLAQQILIEAGAPKAELSVSLVGDSRMRRLNRQYRRRDHSTDVLAFAMREAPGPPSSVIGDVVISRDAAGRQARMAGHSIDREIVILLIHGTLHLLGYDHERSTREARRMQGKEQAILQALRPIPKLLRTKERGN